MKQYAPLETAKTIAFDAFFWPFKKVSPQTQIAIAGSILRKKEIVHDIDICIGSMDESLRNWARNKIESTDNSQSINFKGQLYGFQTDVWFTEPESWAPMLLFATGPRAFNIFMRKRAKDQDMVLNQKGLFERTKKNECGPRLDNNTEGNIIYLVIHRRWIPPEERDAFSFPTRERKIPKMCIICKGDFKKGDRLIQTDQGDWVHEIHLKE